MIKCLIAVEKHERIPVYNSDLLYKYFRSRGIGCDRTIVSKYTFSADIQIQLSKCDYTHLLLINRTRFDIGTGDLPDNVITWVQDIRENLTNKEVVQAWNENTDKMFGYTIAMRRYGYDVSQHDIPILVDTTKTGSNHKQQIIFASNYGKYTEQLDLTRYNLIHDTLGWMLRLPIPWTIYGKGYAQYGKAHHSRINPSDIVDKYTEYAYGLNIDNYTYHYNPYAMLCAGQTVFNYGPPVDYVKFDRDSYILNQILTYDSVCDFIFFNGTVENHIPSHRQHCIQFSSEDDFLDKLSQLGIMER